MHKKNPSTVAQIMLLGRALPNGVCIVWNLPLDSLRTVKHVWLYGYFEKMNKMHLPLTKLLYRPSSKVHFKWVRWTRAVQKCIPCAKGILGKSFHEKSKIRFWPLLLPLMVDPLNTILTQKNPVDILYIVSLASEVGSPTNPPWAPGSDKTPGQGSFGPLTTYKI